MCVCLAVVTYHFSSTVEIHHCGKIVRDLNVLDLGEFYEDAYM